MVKNGVKLQTDDTFYDAEEITKPLYIVVVRSLPLVTASIERNDE